MKTNHIIRAWKDNNYRQKLSEAERAELPAHPSGMIELNDSQLGAVSGARATAGVCNTLECPTHLCPTRLGCTHQVLCTSTCD